MREPLAAAGSRRGRTPNRGWPDPIGVFIFLRYGPPAPASSPCKDGAA